MAVFGGFSNITKVPELRRRIAFSLGILAIYRVGRNTSLNRLNSQVIPVIRVCDGAIRVTLSPAVYMKSVTERSVLSP